MPKLSKQNPNATEFDNQYSKEDPWCLKDLILVVGKVI